MSNNNINEKGNKPARPNLFSLISNAPPPKLPTAMRRRSTRSSLVPSRGILKPLLKDENHTIAGIMPVLTSKQENDEDNFTNTDFGSRVKRRVSFAPEITLHTFQLQEHIKEQEKKPRRRETISFAQPSTSNSNSNSSSNKTPIPAVSNIKKSNLRRHTDFGIKASLSITNENNTLNTPLFTPTSSNVNESFESDDGGVEALEDSDIDESTNSIMQQSFDDDDESMELTETGTQLTSNLEVNETSENISRIDHVEESDNEMEMTKVNGIILNNTTNNNTAVEEGDDSEIAMDMTITCRKSKDDYEKNQIIPRIH